MVFAEMWWWTCEACRHVVKATKTHPKPLDADGPVER